MQTENNFLVSFGVIEKFQKTQYYVYVIGHVCEVTRIYNIHKIVLRIFPISTALIKCIISLNVTSLMDLENVSLSFSALLNKISNILIIFNFLNIHRA